MLMLQIVAVDVEVEQQKAWRVDFLFDLPGSSCYSHRSTSCNYCQAGSSAWNFTLNSSQPAGIDGLVAGERWSVQSSFMRACGRLPYIGSSVRRMPIELDEKL